MYESIVLCMCEGKVLMDIPEWEDAINPDTGPTSSPTSP